MRRARNRVIVSIAAAIAISVPMVAEAQLDQSRFGIGASTTDSGVTSSSGSMLGQATTGRPSAGLMLPGSSSFSSTSSAGIGLNAYTGIATPNVTTPTTLGSAVTFGSALGSGSSSLGITTTSGIGSLSGVGSSFGADTAASGLRGVGSSSEVGGTVGLGSGFGVGSTVPANGLDPLGSSALGTSTSELTSPIDRPDPFTTTPLGAADAFGATSTSTSSDAAAPTVGTDIGSSSSFGSTGASSGSVLGGGTGVDADDLLFCSPEDFTC
jgi:hypothetical protein